MTKDRRNICNKEDSEFKQINLRGRKREREINRKSEDKRREVTNSSGKGILIGKNGMGMQKKIGRWKKKKESRIENTLGRG